MWRMMAKTAFLWCYVYLWAPLRNLWRSLSGTSHATVLLYHRVCDESLDSVTVKTSQFQRQLNILGRGYQIVSMEQFLRSRGLPRRRTWVVLTFDDGYQDNHAAARLLREARIPCTFFVSTGIVGTSRGFPLDARLKRRIPVLSWEQVREMSVWGFGIANHSVSHVDMGKAGIEESLAEIRQASVNLVMQLGAIGPEKWFAYPFGRPENISEAVRDRLGALGIDYCFSAYGGTNPPDFDPLDIMRQGVNHTFSDLAFRSVIEGYRVRAR